MNAPLSPERSAKIRRLFEELTEHPADTRSAFLDEACKNDPEMRRELISLLQQADSEHPRFDQFARRVVQPMLTALRDDPSGLNILLDGLSASISEEGTSMVGKTVSHFDILAPIGRGGMGVVYRARDRDLDRTVALKFLPPALGADGTAKSRFIQEARAASALDHANIATVFEIGETGDHQLFIAMGYYEGETLKQKLDRGRLTPAEALAFGVQLAAALARAHSNGVTHRDVKPGNVMITKDGTVKLLDFGLAKLADSAGHTRVGEMIGTAAYMSPEQARGESVDARTDVWSLGIVLSEMFTGQRPFRGENSHAVIYSILNDDPAALPGEDSVMDADVSQVVARCLEKDPAQRYQSAGEVLADLQSIGQNSPWSRFRRELRRATRERRTRRAIVAGVAVVSLGIVGAWFLNTFDVVGTARIDSLAVLPFTDLAGNPEQEYFAEGMQEALVGELAKISGLRVISSRSTRRFRDSDLSIPEIARQLNVAAVVEGSVFRDVDQVHLRVQLIATEPEERPVWTQSFQDRLSNVLTMHSGIARSIADEVRIEITAADETRLSRASTVSPESYENYLKGMYYLNKSSVENFQKGIAFFEEAVEKNPADPFAYAGLSLGFVTLGHAPAAPPGVWNKARAAVDRALRLDPTLVDAHVALADIRLYRDWDWEGFEEAYDRVNELNPNVAMMHYHRAWELIRFGRFEEALVAHERAQALDPLTPLHSVWIPGLYFYGSRFEEGVQVGRKTLEQYPGNAVAELGLGLNLAALGQFEEAISIHEAMAEKTPHWRAYLGRTYAMAGQMEDARAILQDLESQPVSPWNAYSLALLHAGMGNFEKALPWIEHRPAHTYLGWLPAEPGFEQWKDDPRFTAALVRPTEIE